MKTKIILLLLVAAGAGAFWYFKTHSAMPAGGAAVASGRKVLYYQSAMHPWIKSDKPGKCPICGMDLVPVYEGDAGATGDTNMVVLNADSVTAVNVKTEAVSRRPLVHTLHVIGTIQKNSATTAWFVFDIYERDLPWIKLDQTLEVTLPSVPDRTYQAEIKSHGTEAFADRKLDEMSDSTKIRARITDAPVEVPGFEGQAYFDGLHAESHIRAATPEVLAVPRSAVIWRGSGPLVYVDKKGGGYEARPLKLGRIGDDFAEVLGGLTEGDKVVTNGGLLIDAEAQLTSGR
ncbi:MAG TPA: heavy metal-binding domain-containing protein [Candidatus Acidoferrales bacterium]|nr:heavy metal-binding domain-containing protein [Candidatus Acidoferrales bacterium]